MCIVSQWQCHHICQISISITLHLTRNVFSDSLNLKHYNSPPELILSTYYCDMCIISILYQFISVSLIPLLILNYAIETKFISNYCYCLTHGFLLLDSILDLPGSAPVNSLQNATSQDRNMLDATPNNHHGLLL